MIVLSDKINYEVPENLSHKPFRFIPFLKTERFYAKDCKLKGIINLKIKPLTPLHISEGDYNCDSDKLYHPFFSVNGVYMIPGTSIKGMVRNMAEMVSHSCIDTRGSMGTKLPKGKSSNEDDCIICDMFGKMRKSSKVKFTNFQYQLNTGKITIEGLPALWSPKPRGNLYFNKGKSAGYKIYNHGNKNCLKHGKYNFQCIGEGAEFIGKVIYRDLNEEELELLCFSLGLSNVFNHKLGYGKPAYYGSIQVEINQIKPNDINYIELAEKYIKNKSGDKDISYNIGLLNLLYKFDKNKNTPDYDRIVY